MNTTKPSKRIVFTTFGSLGDLHPYIALALEWQSRGNSAVIATSESYRKIVESEGLEFAPVRPDMPHEEGQGKVMGRVMDFRGGPRYLIREMVLPALRDSYEDLLAASAGADAVVGHSLTFAAPLAAAKLNIPWAYVALSPMVLLSAYDLPQFVPFRKFKRFRIPGVKLYSLLIALAKRSVRSWFHDISTFSKELGLHAVQQEPMGRDQYSQWLNIALFSSVFAQPQPDWPSSTVITGFPFYDRAGMSSDISGELNDFLHSGEPPIVFTLGSAAVMTAGTFYAESAKAAQTLGRRAVLLVGRDENSRPTQPVPNSIFVAEYAPFSELFPRAAAIVHQGGIGTTAQALRAGKPMLIMPFAFDQPDNARRATKLGVGRTIARKSYSSATAAKELAVLLDGPYAARAQTIGRLIRMENGATFVCDSIESKILEFSL